jgi:hypothetical protein
MKKNSSTRGRETLPLWKLLIPKCHQTSNFLVGARLAVPMRRLRPGTAIYYLYDRNLVSKNENITVSP